jgi:hypothetical protein
MKASRPRASPRGPLLLVHHHPGRLRLRAAVFRDGDAQVAQVRRALKQRFGFTRVLHNPRTGSVLVEYEPGAADPDEVAAVVARAAGLAPVVDVAGGPPTPAEVAVIDAFKRADGFVRSLTGGRAGLALLVPAALASASVYSFVANKNQPRFPRWDTLLYWAQALFLEWHPPGQSTARAEPPAAL